MSSDVYGPAKPVRLFAELDSGTTEKRKRSKYGHETGIRAIEKKSAGFFARIFGKEIQVGGKAYIVSRQSLKAFVERNRTLFDSESSQAAKGIKIDSALKKLTEISKLVDEMLGSETLRKDDIKTLCRNVFKLDDDSTEKILNASEAYPITWEELVNRLNLHRDTLVKAETPRALLGVFSELGRDETYNPQELKQALANISSDEVLHAPVLTFAKSLTDIQKEEKAEFEEVYRLFTGGSVELETIQYLCSDILLLDKTTTEEIINKCRDYAYQGTVSLEHVAASVLQYQSEILTKGPKDYAPAMIKYFNYLESPLSVRDMTTRKMIHREFASALGKMLGGVKVDAEVLIGSRELSQNALTLRESHDTQLRGDGDSSFGHDLAYESFNKGYKLNSTQVEWAVNYMGSAASQKNKETLFAALDRTSQFALIEELRHDHRECAQTYAEKFWEGVPKKQWGPYIELWRKADFYDLLHHFICSKKQAINCSFFSSAVALQRSPEEQKRV